MFKNLFGKSFLAPFAVLLTLNFVLYLIAGSVVFEGSLSWSGIGSAIGGTFGSLQSFGLFLVAILVLAVLAVITLWLRKWSIGLIIWAIVLFILGAVFGSSLISTFGFILNMVPAFLFIAFTAIGVLVLKPTFNRTRG